ncbi:CFDP2 protein, partial [Polypterus senegalus]
MGRYGVKERNEEGQRIVDFAKRMDMAVVNTYFKKMEEHRVMYKSGGRCTQADYILCRTVNLKKVEDCKVVAGESVVKQHRMEVCRMTLKIKKRKRVRAEPRIKWWKKEDCKVEFREKVRQALDSCDELPDSWETTADVVRVTARRVLGVTSGQRKEEKETWWWNGEVQKSTQKKRIAKKKWKVREMQKVDKSTRR